MNKDFSSKYNGGIMKNKFLHTVELLLLIFFFSNISIFADDPPKFNYVGVEACGKCHKSDKQGKQLAIWKESIHSNAYITLLGAEAAKVAKEMGYEKAPNELSECLVCHASGYEVDADRLEAGFKIEDGVQCETCHGAGSGYKSIKIMKDKKLAIQNGLVNVFENTSEYCQTCHNPDSPTFSGFDFEKMWAKVEHYIPVTKKE